MGRIDRRGNRQKLGVVEESFPWGGGRGELPKSGIDFSRGPPEQALSWFWVLVKSCREDIGGDSSNCCVYCHLNSEAV